ncbi:MAG TPA: hypothetical protein VF145_08280 [Chitinophagaceae bacterium]
MLDNSGIFAFDTDFDNQGTRSFLEVFIKYNPDGTHYYYCVIDDRNEYTFAKRDDGIWVDMKTGETKLATVVGRIIETELSLDHKFHSNY